MALKKSERRLLTVFLSLFAVIVGGMGTMYLVRHFGDTRAELAVLEERRDTMVRMLGESEMWAERSRWIDEKIPSFRSKEDASSQLLDVVSEKAKETGVEISKKQLLTDPDSAPVGGGVGSGESVYFDRVAVVLNLEGDEEKIFRWLHSVQQPESFLGVTHLNYLPSGAGARCSVRVSLWFREDASSNIAIIR